MMKWTTWLKSLNGWIQALPRIYFKMLNQFLRRLRKDILDSKGKLTKNTWNSAKLVTCLIWDFRIPKRPMTFLMSYSLEPTTMTFFQSKIFTKPWLFSNQTPCWSNWDLIYSFEISKPKDFKTKVETLSKTSIWYKSRDKVMSSIPPSNTKKKFKLCLLRVAFWYLRGPSVSQKERHRENYSTLVFLKITWTLKSRNQCAFPKRLSQQLGFGLKINRNLLHQTVICS